MSTLAERLEIAVDRAAANGLLEKQGAQAALARACNTAQPSVSQWFSGRTKTLKGKNLLLASKKLGVRPEWLGQGVGPMALDEAPPAPTPAITVEDALDHLGMFAAALDADGREALATNIAGWARAGGVGSYRGIVLGLLQGVANRLRAA